jgi:hypothetical protein
MGQFSLGGMLGGIGAAGMVGVAGGLAGSMSRQMMGMNEATQRARRLGSIWDMPTPREIKEAAIRQQAKVRKQKSKRKLIRKLELED